MHQNVVSAEPLTPLQIVITHIILSYVQRQDQLIRREEHKHKHTHGIQMEEKGRVTIPEINLSHTVCFFSPHSASR